MSRFPRATRWLLAVVSALTVVAMTAAPSPAFRSYPPGSEHDQITAAAATAKGWSKKSSTALQKAVRAVDWDESKKKSTFNPFEYIPNENYRANHHFDRAPTVSTKDTFTSSATYMRGETDAAITAAKNGNTNDAIAALGRALHALEDFKSHANYIDLAGGDQLQCRDALADGNKLPAGTLVLTGYDPAAAQPESPKDDAYPHLTKSKDFQTKNDEAKTKVGDKTKFELARDSAIAEVTCLLQQVRNGLTKPQWDALRGAEVAPDPNDEKYDGACSTSCPPSGCALSCDLPDHCGIYCSQNHPSVLEVAPGTFARPDIELTVLGVPNEFFFTGDVGQASDLARMAVVREIRAEDPDPAVPDPTYFFPPAGATVEFALSDVATLRGSSLQVYYFTPSDGWTVVMGATVDVSGSVGTASFPVAAPGAYGIGGLSLPRPDVPFADVHGDADDAGCVPTTHDRLRCSNGAAKALGLAIRGTIRCHRNAVHAVFTGGAYDDEACEHGPAGGKSVAERLDTALARLATVCTGTEIPARVTLEAATLFAGQGESRSLDALNGDVYCDPGSGTPLDPGGDDAGFVPASKAQFICADQVAKALSKLNTRVAKCHVKMARRFFNGTDFDEEGCEEDDPLGATAALERYATAMDRLDARGVCTQPCLSRASRDALAQRMVALHDCATGLLYPCGDEAAEVCGADTTTTTTTTTTTDASSTTTTTLCVLSSPSGAFVDAIAGAAAGF